MKGIRKRVLILAVFLFPALLPAGCSEEQSDPVEITLIHGWGSTEEDHVAMRQIYKDFEKENPDIEINLISMPSSTDMVQKVEDMLTIGEIPDVIFLGGIGKDTVYDFMVENDLAVDLMPYLEADEDFYNSIAPVNLDFWITDGCLYTISDVLLLSGGYWYNEEIFEAAGVDSVPGTWDEFYDACEKITAWAEAEGNGVRCLQMPAEAYLYFADHMMAIQNAASGRAIKSHQLVLRNSSVTEILEELKKVYTYSKAEGNLSYLDDTSLFNEGKSAMYVNGVWGAPMISEDIQASYALLPATETETISCESACLGYLLGNTGDERRQDAAAAFIKYMLSEEVQTRILTETGQMPANPQVDLTAYQEEMSRFCQAAVLVQSADVKIEAPDNIWSSYEKQQFIDHVISMLEGNLSEEDFINLLKSGE